MKDSWSGSWEDATHFSYEDQGELRLHALLTLSMIILAGLTVKEYRQYYLEEQKTCSIHLLVLISLSIQILSQVMQTIHLYFYSRNGQGVQVLDVISMLMQ